MKKWISNTVVTKFKLLIDGEDPNGIKYVVGFVFVLGLTAFLIQFHSAEEVVEKPVIPTETIDTYVPEGMTLVPVELSNYESLDQVIGQYGVVDLMTTPLSPLEKPKYIARKVKIVKSGHHHPIFHVLVKEKEAIRITAQAGELIAIVRNPKSLGTKFVNRKVETRSRKIYYDMETK